MSETLKLNDITTPVLKLELPGGEVKEYDLYELGERLTAVDAVSPTTGDVDLPAFYDGVRRAFDLPTAAEARDANAFTLSRAQCQSLKVTVAERITDLPEQKRFFALVSRGSAGSTDSPPTKSPR